MTLRFEGVQRTNEESCASLIVPPRSLGSANGNGSQKAQWAHATKKKQTPYTVNISMFHDAISCNAKKLWKSWSKKITVASVIQQPVECLTKCMCQFSWTSVDTILQVEKIKLWTQIISSSVEECSIKYCTYLHSRHRENHRFLIGVTFFFHDKNDPQFWTFLVGLLLHSPRTLHFSSPSKLFWIPLGREHLSFSKGRGKPQTHHRFFLSKFPRSLRSRSNQAQNWVVDTWTRQNQKRW